ASSRRRISTTRSRASRAPDAGTCFAAGTADRRAEAVLRTAAGAAGRRVPDIRVGSALVSVVAAAAQQRGRRVETQSLADAGLDVEGRAQEARRKREAHGVVR